MAKAKKNETEQVLETAAAEEIATEKPEENEFKEGDKVRFINETLHDLDNAYPPAGSIGTFVGYNRPDKSRAFVQWEIDDTKEDGLWACLTSDLAAVKEE